MLIVAPIVGFCNCCMFCCALLYVHSSFAIILKGKRELVASLCLSSSCLVIVVWLFFTMPQICLQFVIVVFPDHTHLLFFTRYSFYFTKVIELVNKLNESFCIVLTLFRSMKISTRLHTVKSGWSIVYIERLQAIISKKTLYFFL